MKTTRPLLPFFLLFCSALSAHGESRGVVVIKPVDGAGPIALYDKSYALVIGIDAYSDGWPRLSNAVADAKAVAAEFETHGFDVTLATDLQSDSLEEALEDFVYERGRDPEARLLIWFAGHGHMIGEEAYLVPADAPLPEDDGQFRRKALSMRDFGKFMREVRSRHVLAIFDSCFSGNVFQSTRSAISPAVTRATSLPVRQMISSGDAGQVVSDDSTFRKLFLAALVGEEPNADANKDGYLTGSELGLFLTDKVTSLTNSRQTPRFGALRELEYDRGDFVFRIQPSPSQPSDVAVVAPPPANSPVAPQKESKAALPGAVGRPIGVFENQKFDMCGYRDFRAVLVTKGGSTKEVSIHSRDRQIPGAGFRGFERLLPLDTPMRLWENCVVSASYEARAGVGRIVFSVSDGR